MLRVLNERQLQAKKQRIINLIIAIIGKEKFEQQVAMLEKYSFFMGKGESHNAKTGKIPQVYSCKNSCPANCPFKYCGCYARQGHCNLWFDVAGGRPYKKAHQEKPEILSQPITELKNRLLELKAGQMTRHNVSGDIAVIGSDEVNGALLTELIIAYNGLAGYTYTHCDTSKDNLDLLKIANNENFVINKSCEKISDVKKCVSVGVPCVLAVEKLTKKIQRKDGVLYVQCPAQVDGELMNCGKCTACQNKNRKAVIVFEAHGSKSVVKKIKAGNILAKEF